MDKIVQEKVPCLYGALVLYVAENTSRTQIKNVLEEYVNCQVFEGCTEIVYREVRNFCSWDVDELLTALFAQCNFAVIYSAQKRLGARVLIDISFTHYDKFPALIFCGDNMNQIHALEADISIDPY